MLAEFKEWYDGWFGSAQGEELPYIYDDVYEAYKAGWKAAKRDYNDELLLKQAELLLHTLTKNWRAR